MWVVLLALACGRPIDRPVVADDTDVPLTDPPFAVVDTGEPAVEPDPEGRRGAVRVGRVWYQTIQDALDEAPPGSTLWVQPGEHVGPFGRVGDWQVTIRGATGRSEDVVLTAPDGEQVFRFGWRVPRETVIRDLTVRPGRAPVSGAAMGVIYDGQFSMYRVIVDGGHGALYYLLSLDGGQVVVEDSMFLGGAIALDVRDGSPLTAEIRRTVFDGSTRGEEVGNRFVQVTSERLYESMSVTFEDCEFRNTHMGGNATVVLTGYHPVATFRRSRFTGNTFGWGLGGSTMMGAALLVKPDSYMTPPSQADVLVEDCVFEDNIGEAGPSALRVDYAWDTRVPELMPLATVTVRRTSFRRNVTGERTLRGGAIDAQQGTRLLLEDVDFGTGADGNLPSDIGCWTWEGRELGEDVSAEIECR